MSDERMLNLNEVALLVGVGVQTINYWYRWKKLHPDNEYAKFLPDFVRIGNRNTRYWKQSDVWKLTEFRSILPQGCKGIMGDVTQKYVRNKIKREKEGK